jgi:hypothetical protein
METKVLVVTCIEVTQDGVSIKYYPVDRRLDIDLRFTWLGRCILHYTEYMLFMDRMYAAHRHIINEIKDELCIVWRPWDGKPELISERNRRKCRIFVLLRLKSLLLGGRDLAKEIAKLM